MCPEDVHVSEAILSGKLERAVIYIQFQKICVQKPGGIGL